MRTNISQTDNHKIIKPTVLKPLPDPQIFNLSFNPNTPQNEAKREVYKAQNDEHKSCARYSEPMPSSAFRASQAPPYFILTGMQSNGPPRTFPQPCKDVAEDQQLQRLMLKYRYELFTLFKATQ